jgi:DNA-directed RNA polymerase specialized sigma54-like protein
MLKFPIVEKQGATIMQSLTIAQPKPTAQPGLSTEDIAAVLSKQGIEPSRTNIAKVREVLRIQASGYMQAVLYREHWEDFLDE